MPTLDSLVKLAETLVDCFMSQDAYERALSRKNHNNTLGCLYPPTGEPWIPPSKPPYPSEEMSTTKGHTEEDGFDGDRILANSILFLMEYGWWIEASYAIPEGDIGRFWEIMKVICLTQS